MLTLPWLWPVAIGPWPATLPWLVSLACAALLLAMLFWWRIDLPRVALWAWLLAALLSSVVGLVQYAGWSSDLAPFVNTTPMGEAFANLRQRNQFATLTNIGLVSLLAWLAMGRGALDAGGAAGAEGRADTRHSADRESRAVTIGAPGRLPLPVWLGLACLLAVANAASSSRTGLLQLGLVAVLVWVWGGWRQSGTRAVLFAAALAYGSAAWALPRLLGLDPSASGILARLQDGAPPCASRLTLWGNVLTLVAHKPWWGWGWGELDYAHFMTLYPGARFCDILDNAHNLPLHIAVELGVPAALVFCGVGAWLVWRARPWRETQPLRQLAWAVLALILVHSLLEYPLWYGPFQIAALLSVWILCSGSGGRAALPGGRAAATLLALSMLAGAAYAAWDYRRVSQVYLAVGARAPAYRDNTFAKVQGTRLFARQLRFAELTTARLTPDNAGGSHALALELLHFSPEARVVEKVIESAELLGRQDEAAAYRLRYQAAFPTEYAQWVRARAQP